jgi:hypothetical protein
MLGELSPVELLPIGPRFTGSPKVKSAFATEANVKTNTIEISFVILVFIVIFSYLIGIFTKVTFEKHIYTYYTTARYIADKPWQILSFTSLALLPFCPFKAC